MRKVFAASAAFILLCLGGAAVFAAQGKAKPCCGPDSAMVGEDADKTQVHLPVGKEVSVRLAGDPTTGWSWEVLDGAGSAFSVEEPLSYHPAPKKPGVTGAGGEFATLLRALSEGRALLRLVYRRPWEKDVAQARTFSVELVAFAKTARLDEGADRGFVLVPKGAQLQLKLMVDDETLTQEMVRPKGPVAFVDSDFSPGEKPQHLYRFRAAKAGEDELRVRFRRDGPVSKVVRDYRVAVRVY
ncbi:MAG: protease inhibitor I42 family protein [Elusimicrobia bacterium]|nr:protease inhibitor I42 family protein [Elusimicrobiota bacterium]